jgi:hypothetical protein
MAKRIPVLPAKVIQYSDTFAEAVDNAHNVRKRRFLFYAGPLIVAQDIGTDTSIQTQRWVVCDYISWVTVLDGPCTGWVIQAEVTL